MNEPNYINVYQTISPNKFYAYSKWISKICFGIESGSNEHYAFISNHLTGHFSFHVNPKHYPTSSTPQNEQEAKKNLDKAIIELKSKLSNASENNNTFPKDFPTLFNHNHIKLKGLVPLYNKDNDYIISWRALYSIELKVFSSSSSNENKSDRTTLEGDSIIVEISGNRIVVLNYNHTPIISRKESLIFPDENSEFIYKKINQNTIAPYYLTSIGYIPACKDSVAILTQPVSSGWTNPENTGKGFCKSMVTLSNVVHPENGLPGSAKISISMDYKIVTLGEGAVDNITIINPTEFSKLYSQGNAPGTKYKEHLKIKSLPTKESIASQLTSREYRRSKRIDKTTGKPIFGDYYNVQVEYQFNLDAALGFSLWEGIKWIMECPYSRGLFYLLPFEQEVLNWHNSSKLTIKDIQNELTREEKNSYNKEQLNQLLDARKSESRYIALSKSVVFTLKNIIVDNIEKYTEANLYGDSNISILYDYIIEDIELKNILSSVNSELHKAKGDDLTKPWIEIDEFSKIYMEYVYPPINFAKNKIDKFEKGGNTPEVGAAGMLNHPNFVVLNPKLFGKSSIGKKFVFGNMLPSEILVHEAGHNAAVDFYHTEDASGDYEYNQEGLQSNEHNKVYPTKQNTIGIINDAENRNNMTII